MFLSIYWLFLWEKVAGCWLLVGFWPFCILAELFEKIKKVIWHSFKAIERKVKWMNKQKIKSPLLELGVRNQTPNHQPPTSTNTCRRIKSRACHRACPSRRRDWKYWINRCRRIDIINKWTRQYWIVARSINNWTMCSNNTAICYALSECSGTC